MTYYLARHSPWGSVTLMMDYPQKEAATWNPVVKRMEGSTRQVERRAVQ